MSQFKNKLFVFVLAVHSYTTVVLPCVDVAQGCAAFHIKTMKQFCMEDGWKKDKHL